VPRPTGQSRRLRTCYRAAAGRYRHSGTKAIVTGAPYIHEFLVMPCRTHTGEDAAFAVCCAVPVDAPGVTIVARPAGRPGEAAAQFSAKYGQSTGVVIFDNVFVSHERVFLGACPDNRRILLA